MFAYILKWEIGCEFLNFVPAIDFTCSQFPVYEKKQ